jgi:hypothetical protein
MSSTGPAGGNSIHLSFDFLALYQPLTGPGRRRILARRSDRMGLGQESTH